MKKVLFDFITFEDKYINGGNLYARTVLNKILEKNVHLYGLCNEFNNLNSEIKQIVEEYNIQLISTSKDWVDKVNNENFDLFFIGIAQRYNNFDLQRIKCKIYIVCHDVCNICLYKAKNFYNFEANYNIYKSERRKFPKLRCYKTLTKRIIYEKSILGFTMPDDKIMKYFGYTNFKKLIAQPNVFVITVSEYSKCAIEYYFDKIANPIKVFYPPIINKKSGEVSDEIKKACDSKKYFLFVSANRESKNFIAFENVFDKFNKRCDNRFNAIVVGLSNCKLNNAFCFSKVNDAGMDYLMQNAYCLVYSSLAEGFGYPPIEAMHFGTPVLAAFDTSIPEVCGKDVLFFNPQYEEDLYLKCTQLVKDYEKYVEVAKNVSGKVEQKQIADLENLTSYILN